ncbi:MAG: barstar family protein [Gammaproteobacteria bacterium]|nr:barstar family protein [Gammaproteobacteria bacterium]
MDRVPFCFGRWSGSAVLIGQVPSGLGSKRELLEVLGSALDFPGYYGINWDALWDCLCDFEWLPEGDVVIRHEDLPLEGDSDSVRTYLSILEDSVEKWANSDERSLIIVFPPHIKAKIATYDWSD